MKRTKITILGILALSSITGIDAEAATPIVKTNLPKTTLKTNESFSLSYSLINSKSRKVSNPTGSITLNSYTDSSCSQGQAQLGSALDLSSSNSSSYSFSGGGLYYVKPEISGYTGQCLGPIDVKLANVPFERLTVSSSIANNKRTLSLRWEDLSGNLSVEATSKASVSLYSNASCSGGRVRGSRTYSVKPKNGQASLVINNNSSPLYAKSISGSLSSCVSVSSQNDEPTVQACSTSDVSNSTQVSGTKPNCIAESCTDGFHVNPDSGSCDYNFPSCSISNGTGYHEWQGSSYSSNCFISSCNSGYHENASSCESDVIECSDDTGTGTQTWNGSSFGSCFYNSCLDSNYEVIEGLCSPISCTVQNSGIANAYSVEGDLVTGCHLQTCQFGYQNLGDSCLEVPTCSTADIPGSSTVYFSENFFSCAASTCESGYHLETSSFATGEAVPAFCESNTRSCSIANGSGTQSWEPSNFIFSDQCSVSSCNSGYQIDSLSNSCVATQCTLANANKLNASIVSGTLVSGCSISKCNDGYLLFAGSCIQDSDGDGFPSSSFGGNDCNDTTSSINPSAQEVCDNGIDNNCNGLSDDNDPTSSLGSKSTFFLDSDGNGYGDPSSSTVACAQPAGYSPLRNVEIILSSLQYDSVSAGGNHTCALTSSGGVKCWGYNYYGQLGDNSILGNNPPKYTAVDVSGLTSGVVSVSSGGYHTCAVTYSGGVKCWGRNLEGQLGNTTTNFNASSLPVSVAGLTSGVTSVSSAANHTCAVTSSGGVKCWGYNGGGQLGNGTTTNSLVPVDVTGLTSGVVSLSTGISHMCALTVSGGVKCWGYNGGGQLGNGTTTNSLVPVDVSGLTSGVVSVSGGERHTCAVTSSGEVKCWGRSLEGQLGNGTTTSNLVPVSVSGLTSGVTSVSSAANHTCALTSSGGVKCWGDNSFGGLGNGTTTNSLVPVDVSGLTSGVVSVTSSAYHTCALTSSGGVKCWGRNLEGQLGNNSATNSSIPVDTLNINVYKFPRSMLTYGTCNPGYDVKFRKISGANSNISGSCSDSGTFLKEMSSKEAYSLLKGVESPNRKFNVYQTIFGQNSPNSTTYTQSWPSLEEQIVVRNIHPSINNSEFDADILRVQFAVPMKLSTTGHNKINLTMPPFTTNYFSSGTTVLSSGFIYGFSSSIEALDLVVMNTFRQTWIYGGLYLQIAATYVLQPNERVLENTYYNEFSFILWHDYKTSSHNIKLLEGLFISEDGTLSPDLPQASILDAYMD